MRVKLAGYAVPPTPPPVTDVMVYARYEVSTDTQEIWQTANDGTGSPANVTTQNTTGHYDTNPYLDPTGTQLVYTTGLTSQLELHVIGTNGAGDTTIDTASSAYQTPQWGGGDVIVFRDGADTYTINPDGTGKTLISPSGPDPTILHFTFNHDGTLLAFHELRGAGNPERLWVCEPDGSNAVVVATLDNTALTNVWFGWARGSDKIAYIKGQSNPDVRTVNADGTGDTSILHGEMVADGADSALVTRLSWAPDDSAVYVTSVKTAGTWRIWKIMADGSLDTQLVNPTGANQSPGAGTPYVFGSRVWTIDDSANPSLVSSALDGTDPITHDGGADVFPYFQEQE